MLSPFFSEDHILQEELFLTFRNFTFGLLGLWAVSGFVAYVVYIEMHTKSVFVWFMAFTATVIGMFIRYSFLHDKSITNPKREVIVQSLCIASLALVWGILPILYLDQQTTPSVVITILSVGCGFAAGSVAMNGTCLPVFIAYTYPVIAAMMIGLAKVGDFIFVGLAYALFAFAITLTWFSLNMRKSVRDSVTLKTDNNNLVRKLRSALIQTDEANRAKSVFLASASHDLRQPIHALGLLTETLGNTELNDDQTKVQQHMLQAVASTQRMLESLLNISKLDAGAISSDPKPFLLQTLFSELESELAPVADEKGLIYRSRETILAVHSDPMIVELIVRNLIANAIRYTDSGGLLVGYRKRAERVLIEVWDTGIGIEPDHQQEIFNEFNQLSNPERDSLKGFGLGLSIAQGLAKALGSKISVRSVAGKGSVFRFELPLSDADLIPDLDQTITTVSFDGHSILVVDDDHQVRASMRGLLKSWNCNCLEAESADEAIKLLNENGNAVDLLLVDYRLREQKTGRDAIEQIRQHLDKAVPAIIITGDTAVERIQDAQSAEALLLHKPASTMQLQRMIHNLLNEQQAS